MISVKNINQYYGNFQVLNDVSVDFPEGKITALIGANGAGKSTLLSVVSRLLKPKSGEVFIDGVDMAHMKSKDIAKQLSILKQNNHFMLKLTVKELVSFGRFPHSFGRLTALDEEKIEHALVYMKIKEIEDKYIDELSGGQRQRALIAMILSQDTKYILLDEPLNNLDMRYSVEMMVILENLVKDLGKTIIVVMHDINIAAAFAHHIIAMKDGKIINEGNVDTIIEKETLDYVFDHDFCIAGVHGKKVCVYFKEEPVLRPTHMDEEKIKEKEIL